MPDIGVIVENAFMPTYFAGFRLIFASRFSSHAVDIKLDE